MARKRGGNMAGIIDDFRAQWAQVIADGETALANLYAAESELLGSQGIAMQDPKDAEEWQAQYDRVTGIRETVDALSSALDTVKGWYNSATSWIPGLSGMATMGATRALAGVGKAERLNAVPVIAGLTVAGMIALVTKISLVASGAAAFVTYLLTKNDLTEYQSDRYQAYVDSGMSPEAAAEQSRKDTTTQAKTTTGYEFVSGINKLFLVGGVAALAVFFLPDMLRRARR